MGLGFRAFRGLDVGFSRVYGFGFNGFGLTLARHRRH